MILVYINSSNGLSKSSFEAVTYGKRLGEVVVITNGNTTSDTLSALGEYGASKVLVERNVDGEDAQQLTKLVAWAAQEVGANTVIFSHDLTGKAVAPRLSVRWKAGLVSGAIALPDADGSVRVNVFSGKAIGKVQVQTSNKIISLLPNSIQPEKSGASCAVNEISANVGSGAVKVVSTKKPEGEIPLPEAELVVSAGRGLKGPENWGIIEDLAKSINAATACSRPVADIGWRPHHEHVGQTGVAIRPNLYIAVGISGAIQHLAGVNGSKVIVVINTDPEAPFFKAADYGIVGDAFEVVPKLTAAIQKFKATQL
ncbi:MAG TPA: electron transfer flavoprotein subunit alpha [Crocinitomicaceae bacterium]|nr:electron transfer flavoprotein subunit alpha/FixB family protein [Flavobacteriales bacterium]HBW85571.1 electron transfer flavoprotein subunit alpha [Crocinitomicaceae bacterium]